MGGKGLQGALRITDADPGPTVGRRRGVLALTQLAVG